MDFNKDNTNCTVYITTLLENVAGLIRLFAYFYSKLGFKIYFAEYAISHAKYKTFSCQRNSKDNAVLSRIS